MFNENSRKIQDLYGEIVSLKLEIISLQSDVRTIRQRQDYAKHFYHMVNRLIDHLGLEYIEESMSKAPSKFVKKDGGVK
jgi:hypothetical protein